MYKKAVREAEPRVRELGSWPEYIQEGALASRVPEEGRSAEGFDAGIACALDLIPRDKQRLSAVLHANYTPEAVAQVRRELQYSEEFGDTETAWWLLACFYCVEGQNCQGFEATVGDFKKIAGKGREARAARARAEYERMQKRFLLMEDGTAIAVLDGGAQAAYVRGIELAIQPNFGIWFVGTYRPSLGLPDDFEWVDPPTPENPKSSSGPVWGSKNYVKCATLSELADVVALARAYLGS